MIQTRLINRGPSGREGSRRSAPEDQAVEQGRSGRDRDTESDDEFDFGSAEEAERGLAEKSESGQKGRSRRREPKPTTHGEDDAIEGE